MILTFVLFLFLIRGITANAQEDTASVTYVPSLDIYLLYYSAEGVSYCDTLVPATKIDPTVHCQVTMETLSLYTYSYSVSLATSSQQYLSSFMVSHPAEIQNPTKPNLRWSQGEFAQHKVWDWSNTRMDPSGLWTPTTDVAPGGSLGSFSFKSTGLPVIVNSYFEGNAQLLAFFGEPPSKMSDLLDPIRVFPNNTVIRRTLGPRLPPSSFVVLDFVDSLIQDINETYALGWITSQSTADKYTGLFGRAKSDIQAANVPSARTRLDSVLMQIHADSGAMLTSESYALLRFNTEYLVRMLITGASGKPNSR